MDEFEHNKQLVAERKKLNEQKRKLNDKQRLEYNITKKIKTTMIGALATFEDFFGDLWGIDKNLDELSEAEMKCLEDWNEARKEILNNGNVQIRAAQDEISEYDTEWNRYKIDFIVKKDGQR